MRETARCFTFNDYNILVLVQLKHIITNWSSVYQVDKCSSRPERLPHYFVPKPRVYFYIRCFNTIANIDSTPRTYSYMRCYYTIANFT